MSKLLCWSKSGKSCAESFFFEKLHVSEGLAAGSKLLSEGHVEDKDSFEKLSVWLLKLDLVDKAGER